MYCLEGLGLDDIATRFGVAASTVQAWAKKYHWREEREAIAAEEADIRANLVRARSLALKKLLQWDGDKETALALSAVDKLGRLCLSSERQKIIRGKTADTKNLEPGDELPLLPVGASLSEGLSPDERIALLEEGVNRQIACLLHNRVDNFSERVRQIKAGLEVVASLRGKEPGAAIEVRFDE